jgi:hypothetical protein
MTARHFNAGVGKQMSMRDGFVVGGPLILLRLEGAAVFTAAILLYAHLGLTWWAFVALILVPDASMLGYLANARIGAASYNVVHTATAPIALLGLAFLLGSSLTMSLGAIWLAHIGVDRMLGYGLKYATGFADTHLGVLGKKEK